MPLENLHDHKHSAWALWKVTEDENVLSTLVPEEKIPEYMTNPSKRLEYIAGRVLLQNLLSHWDLAFNGLRKDDQGKPFFTDQPIHLSLSHSYPYVAAIIDRNKSVGIDLEQPKDKLLHIAPRVLNTSELENASDNIVKHCIYWCGKEALIKIYGKRHLTLAKNLAISPFELEKEGNLTGRIIADGMETTVPLYYRVYDNFVVVLNT